MDRTLAKRNAAAKAVDMIEEGNVVGLGTGSTAAFAIELLGLRVRAGLGIRAVPTSEATASLARQAGIALVGLDEAENVDITIDGADEIDAGGSAIKGGGGALLREKVVAAATRGRRVCVVDESKLVVQLGQFPLPVEVVPFATAAVMRALARLGAKPLVRGSRSDNGNDLIDAAFGARREWDEIARALEGMPGVVAHGLFLDCFDVIVTGSESGAHVRPVSREGPGRFPRL